MRKDLQEIRCELQEICNKEAYRLWRQARRMKNHGVSAEMVQTCANEAFELFNTGYPERILEFDYEYKVKFAFKERGFAQIKKEDDYGWY